MWKRSLLISALMGAALMAALMSTIALPPPPLDRAEVAVAKVEQTPPTVGAVQHLVWVLSEDIGIASEGGTIRVPGAQALAQFRIVCTASELTAVTRNYTALVAYGRRTWSIRVKSSGMPDEYAASLRSALTAVCSM